VYSDSAYRDKLAGINYNSEDEAIERVKAIMDNLDIWGNIKHLQGINDASSLWHGHPVYTLDVFNKLRLTEFNPYFGKHRTIDGVDFSCVDNPGFAPLNPNRAPDTEFLLGSDCYAGITGLFNADYSEVSAQRAAANWNYYYHEGVDFSGRNGGAEIKSFIKGRLLQSGKSASGMGGYVVIQDYNNQKLFYVLVHLATYIDSVTDIVPGSVVGTVGKDEKADAGFHLHLSHVLADKLEEVVSMTHYFNFWKRDVVLGSSDSKRVLNPFDHSEIWKGRGHPLN
jgi:hypothetical protein